MCIETLSRAYATRGLPATDKFVLVTLANIRNRTTGRCNPSVTYLETQTGLSESAIRRAIGRLRAAGVITTRHTGRTMQFSFELDPIGPSAHSDRAQRPIRPGAAPAKPGMNQNEPGPRAFQASARPAGAKAFELLKRELEP